MRTFTLSPEAINRLDSLRIALGRPASNIVDDLIMGRMSVTPPKKRKEDVGER